MITEEKRSMVVRYWFEKAEVSMTSARREFETGFLSFAINRLYYATFYAVSAFTDCSRGNGTAEQPRQTELSRY